MIFDTSGLVCCAIYMILLINDGLVFNARLQFKNILFPNPLDNYTIIITEIRIKKSKSVYVLS